MIALDTVKDFKVLFVGDPIVDIYRYVRVIGKAVKENALSATVGKTESFSGGVWAAAKHTENFCAHVSVWAGPSIMYNMRLVDDIYLRKLFVTHDLKPAPQNGLVPPVRDFDLVVVCDFGHGFMDKAMIEQLTREAKFLAVNAQTNATNYGFNLITKYPRADFVVLDELEARLAVHERDAPIEDVILKLGYEKIIITRGINGAVGYDGVFEHQKAMTKAAIDTMGAGDAFLSVCAPYAAAGASMHDLIHIGNAAGAAKTQIVGHRSSVTREALEKYLG